jgi:hypothetical protein
MQPGQQVRRRELRCAVPVGHELVLGQLFASCPGPALPEERADVLEDPESVANSRSARPFMLSNVAARTSSGQRSSGDT